MADRLLSRRQWTLFFLSLLPFFARCDDGKVGAGCNALLREMTHVISAYTSPMGWHTCVIEDNPPVYSLFLLPLLFWLSVFCFFFVFLFSFLLFNVFYSFLLFGHVSLYTNTYVDIYWAGTNLVQGLIREALTNSRFKKRFLTIVLIDISVL